MRKAATLALVFILCCGTNTGAEILIPKLEPAVLRFDFESGSVGPWASYPPAQDTAYDPTIWIKTVEGNDSRALVREITPNWPIDYEFGVRKKIDFWVDSGSTLSFRFYIKSHPSPEAILVKLAFAGGEAKEIMIPAQASRRWGSATVSFQDLCPKGKARKLAAFGFMARCPKADPEALLKFAIDDVLLSGWKEMGIEIKAPENAWLEEFNTAVAKKHYLEGEEVEIAGNFPAPILKARVRVATALTAEREKTFPLVKAKNGWIARIPGKELGSGIWRAEISGYDSEGKANRSNLVFLIKPKSAPLGHPLLFLTEKDKVRIAELIQGGRPKEIWTNLQKSAAEMRQRYSPDSFRYNFDAYDEIFWLPTYGGYAGSIRNEAAYARANSFVYLIGGNMEAGEAARAALLRMAGWPSFVHPHILNQGQFTYWPVGLVLLDLALSYDWIYDLLSPEERRRAADALYHKGVTEVFKEYVRDNRVSSNTSNWISHVAGGGILSALAVSREFSGRDIEPYLCGMILKLNELIQCAFDRDGNYGEGYGYHNFTMQTLGEIIPVLEMNFGVQFPEKVFRSHVYLPYQVDARKKEIYDFGDTTNYLSSLSNFASVLKKTGDPLLKWLCTLAPGGHDTELIFYDENINSKSPADLPPVKLFRDVGTAVFRSGFGPEDFVFVFRCGPFYNHQHFDQGSFFLADKGELLLSEGGKTDYYNDPWYQKFFIQPGAHNCILVDENEESQKAGDLLSDVPAWRDYARITDFLDLDQLAFVSGDLTKIYKGKFKSLRRSILYLKPRTLILIDQGEAGEGSSRMNLRFHAPLRKDIRVEGRSAQIERPGATLFIKTFLPEQYRAEILKRPLSLAEFGSENPITMSARGFLQLTSELGIGGTTFFNALSTDENMINSITEKTGNGSIDLTIHGVTYSVKTKAQGTFLAQSVETDALIYAPQENGFLALRAQSLTQDGKRILNASSPVSLRLEKEKPYTLSWSAGQRTEIQLYIETQPRRIELNGKPLRGWTYRNHLLNLTLSEGSGILVFLSGERKNR